VPDDHSVVVNNNVVLYRQRGDDQNSRHTRSCFAQGLWVPRQRLIDGVGGGSDVGLIGGVDPKGSKILLGGGKLFHGELHDDPNRFQISARERPPVSCRRRATSSGDMAGRCDSARA
jgi:hypothetical protein